MVSTPPPQPRSFGRSTLFPVQIALIIPAAGSGTRYSASGGMRSKLDEDLGGRPVLQRTVENFVNHAEVGPLIKAILVAGPHDSEAFAEFKGRHGDRLALLGCTLLRGGAAFRYETVQAALAALAALPVASEITHVAIHDAARPCTSQELLQRVIEHAARHSAVIPGLEVSDTVKRCAAEDAPPDESEDDPVARILGVPAKPVQRKVVKETIPRENLVLVQTPQIFAYALLKKAYAQKDLSSTDDAGLVERLGAAVEVVAGEERNIKITRPGDLVLARSILHVSGPAERAAHKRF